MRRRIAAAAVVLLAAGLVVACGSRPTVEEPPADLGPGPAGNAGDGYDDWAHLVEYSVRYDSGIRFLLVGQRHPGGSWRALHGEGTGP